MGVEERGQCGCVCGVQLQASLEKSDLATELLNCVEDVGVQMAICILFRNSVFRS